MVGLDTRLPPMRIATERLVLSCWDEDAASLLKDAVDSSLPELQKWMDWAPREPQPLDVWRERMALRRADFLDGRDFFYLILDPSEQLVLGSTGLHPRIGPNAMEIGYWVRTDQTGKGVATQAARALTSVAFEEAAVHRLEIRCDPNNKASAAIPRRLGYRMREILQGDALTPAGEPRDTMVWELTLDEFRSFETGG
jgi:RimJ/RimL family protein N-acetyltransferase